MKTIELIASIATIIAVPLTLITYFCAKQREKRVFTFVRLNELFACNDALLRKDLNKDYPDYLLYTRTVDRFAAEYMERVLCRKIDANRAGRFLIRNYEKTLRQIIEKQRKQHSRNSYFENIVKMVADLRKRQESSHE